MQFQITSLNFRYIDSNLSSVHVTYIGFNEDRSASINGTLPLTAEQYQGNEPINQLTNLVKQIVSEQLSPTQSE